MKKHRVLVQLSSSDQGSAPSWIVTYADLVTLLLCVFVVLFSMSAIRPDRFETALGSLHGAFGSQSQDSPGTTTENSLAGKLKELLLGSLQDAQSEPAQPWLTVSRTANGVRIVLAGPDVFGAGQAKISEKAAHVLAQIASLERETKSTFVISGHSAGEHVDSGDRRYLSYVRAAEAARRLEVAGVEKSRVTVIALGDDHPALDHAFTEKRRGMNRRLEIDIVEGSVLGAAAWLELNRQG